MSFELDHIFILVSKDAPEAGHLIKFGLTEGPNRVHQGQGTQNRCFFFDNVMLELLWVYDALDTQNESTSPTTLWPRWNQRTDTASAFGLCLRTIDGSEKPPPFKAWKYQPKMFPKPMFVWIADSVTRLDEPFIFLGNVSRRQDSYVEPVIRQHQIGFKELTAVSINAPQFENSDSFNALLEHNIITIKSELGNKIELQFDGGAKGLVRDFSPELPLVIKW